MSQQIVEKHKEIIYNSKTPKAVLMESIFALMNEGSYDSKHILFDIARNHECELIRHETIFSIGELGSDNEIRDFLKDTLNVDKSVVVQHEALVVLGILGKSEDLSFLEKYSNNEDLVIRNSALIGVQRIKQLEDFEGKVLREQEESRKRLLDESVSNNNDRIQILFQLMKDSNDKNVEAIYQCLLHDSCPIVRHEAGFVLGEMNSDLALKRLMDATLKQEWPIAIHECLFALGTTGKEEAMEVVNQYLDNDIYIISESAEIAKQKIELVKTPYRGV